jgi:hypothetical protein
MKQSEKTPKHERRKTKSFLIILKHHSGRRWHKSAIFKETDINLCCREEILCWWWMRSLFAKRSRRDWRSKLL